MGLPPALCLFLHILFKLDPTGRLPPVGLLAAVQHQLVQLHKHLGWVPRVRVGGPPGRTSCFGNMAAGEGGEEGKGTLWGGEARGSCRPTPLGPAPREASGPASSSSSSCAGWEPCRQDCPSRPVSEMASSLGAAACQGCPPAGDLQGRRAWQSQGSRWGPWGHDQPLQIPALPSKSTWWVPQSLRGLANRTTLFNGAIFRDWGTERRKN